MLYFNRRPIFTNNTNKNLESKKKSIGNYLCKTTSGNCYHESHGYKENRGRSLFRCCYCQKRCCPSHRYWICLACFFVIKPFLLLHSALLALLPRRNNWYYWIYNSYFLYWYHILFPTEVDVENACYLYSACLNSTNRQEGLILGAPKLIGA